MKVIVCCSLLFGLAVAVTHEGSVRLSHQSSPVFPHSGFVEIFVNRTWLHVTNTNWTIAESDVVCRQLGYSAAASILESKYYCSSMKPATGSNVVTDVKCTGREDSLTQCQYSVEYTSAQSNIPCGVVCAVPYGLRLTNSSEMHHGRLEVLLDSGWEPVCGSMFDSRHAKAACRQLGYLDGNHAEEMEVEGSFAFINGNCSGDEFVLAGCSSNQEEDPIQLTNCSSSVSLKCFGPPFKLCFRSSAQLVCDSVALTWGVPPSSSPEADSYSVRYRALGGGETRSWSEFNQTNREDLLVTAVINGLQPSEMYEVTIQASNVYGNSSASDLAVVRTNIPG